MSWTTKIVALGIAATGGAIALRLIPTEQRHRMGRAVGDWTSRKMIDHMGRVMASLPESAPPKMISSILPKLQAQNEQILAMLREQNELLKHQQPRTTT